MNLCSASFLAFLCGVVVVFRLLNGTLPRQIFLALANAFFLVTLVPNAMSWFTLAFFVVGTYLAL